MRAAYDFHLHSCLSPCGDADMTPNNIVNMAKLLGLDVIALTDHNSCRNCEAAVEVGKQVGVCVVPGMELSTSEDIHVVCLFPDTEKAMAFSRYVREHTAHIANRPEVYGAQQVLNSSDECIGEEADLLLLATEIGIEQAFDLVKSHGGFAYPAHIDRDSYSVTAVLGDLPPECNHGFAEMSYDADESALRALYSLEGVELIQSSDAHYLENMKEATNYIELEALTPQAVVNYFAQRAKN
ncbi:MAG: PHP domain-containing protein [Ruminococcaceae bacterium]|nr:PHP domain-containing protein [Oscillospiraceae bacterium]